MKKTPFLYALGLGLTASWGAAQASSLEAGLLGHYLWTDADRQYVDDPWGAAVDGIWMINPADGISFRLSQTALPTDDAPPALDGIDFRRRAASLGYWRYLENMDLPHFRPYVNASVGYAEVDSPDAGGLDENGLTVDFAGGVVSKFDLGITNLKFRSEVRVNWDHHDDGFLDVGLGAGIHYSFGGGRAAAPAAPPAPAAPAPKPAPAPAAPPPSNDEDGDGVTNDKDACPGTERGAKVDARGCIDISKVVLKGVSFATGSAVLRSGANQTLLGIAATLKANPKLKVEVGGHSDSMGDDAANMTLSERRAQSVKSFLVKEGVPADRVSVRGYGETKPVDTNETASGRANNRRVEFKITDGQ